MSGYFAGMVDFVGTVRIRTTTTAPLAVFLLALSEAVPVIGRVDRLDAHHRDLCSRDRGSCKPMAPAYCCGGGGYVGDGFSFWLGQRYHREMLLGWPLNKYAQFIARSEAFISKYGAASVFLARFIAVVRAFVPSVAGHPLGMSPRQLYVANILSALVWAPVHVFSGILLAVAMNLSGLSAAALAIIVAIRLISVSIALWAIRLYLSTHPYSRPLYVVVAVMARKSNGRDP